MADSTDFPGVNKVEPNLVLKFATLSTRVVSTLREVAMNSCFATRPFRRLNFRITKLVALASMLLLAVAIALIYVNRSSAAGGDIDSAFNPGGGGADGIVRVVAVQPDGTPATVNSRRSGGRL